MKRRRFAGGDNDTHLWPFTWSRHGGSWKPLGIMLCSGGEDDCSGELSGCNIRLSAFGYSLICELPPLVPVFRIRHKAMTWDEETVKRLGRDWYDEVFPREFGFHFSEQTLHTHYGPQTHDSRTTKSKCFFLPWRNWTFIRTSFYDLKADHFWTEPTGVRLSDRGSWVARCAVMEALPKVRFEFDDYDGKRIVATSHIEEREWRFGTGLFSWLRLFRKPMIQRSLSLEFSEEVGPEKGSWKGGTTGHSIEMRPGELHEAAFRRYCEKEHRSKYRKFNITYVGRIAEPPPPPPTNEDACCASEVAP